MKRSGRNRQEGFTLVEGVVVISILMVLSAVAILGFGSALRNAKANSGMDTLVSQLRSARELAIAHRCEVQVRFVGPNQLTTSEIWLAGTPPPPVSVSMEGGANFELFGSIPDTPAGFGNSSALEFEGISGGPPIMKFTTTGAFVDGGNTFVNGTAFVGIAGNPSTARAVTILGATGRVRQYHWDGTQWQE